MHSSIPAQLLALLCYIQPGDRLPDLKGSLSTQIPSQVLRGSKLQAVQCEGVSRNRQVRFLPCGSAAD